MIDPYYQPDKVVSREAELEVSERQSSGLLAGQEVKREPNAPPQWYPANWGPLGLCILGWKGQMDLMGLVLCMGRPKS